MLAPLLLTLLRSGQGLSVGGESSGATAFVVEYAPQGLRGWYGAWLWPTLALGMAGGIGVALVAALLTRETAFRPLDADWPTSSHVGDAATGCPEFPWPGDREPRDGR